MTLAPYLAAPLEVQIHAAAAFTALMTGPVALWRKRRDRTHKIVGYVWVLAMAIAALSSFFITSVFSPIGLGPIHLLSVYGLWGLYVSLRAIYRGEVMLHRRVMENVYVRGLALAGAFNLLPGRTSQQALIPDAPEIGFLVIALVLVWAFMPLLRRSRSTAPV